MRLGGRAALRPWGIPKSVATWHRGSNRSGGSRPPFGRTGLGELLVRIVSAKESWAAEFREIGASLRRALGHLALRIDHIGSTSVPGLPAKDVIDIQISVTSLDRSVASAMTAAGYVQPEGIWGDHRPPGGASGTDSDWAKLHFLAAPGQRATNVHVRAQRVANERYALLFRDYLRTHPPTAEAYAELKARLTDNLRNPRLYPQVEDPAVDLIYLAAEDWAMASRWQPGPSDA